MSVRIDLSNLTSYNLQFINHVEEIKPVEYLRFFLNFYSKMFLISDNQTKNELKLILSEISRTDDIKKTIDSLKIKNKNLNISSKQFISTQYYYKNIKERYVTTNISIGNENQIIIGSIITIFIFVISKLDDYQLKHILPKSLKILNETYDNIKNPSLIDSYNIPNHCFIQATML